jgi:sigma-B regulation protein RsbU (phosphoserine phosphatase)
MTQPFKKFEALVYHRLGRMPPRTRLHRTAFWLVIVYIILGLGRLFPGSAGEVFKTISFFVFCTLLVCCVPLFWSWVMRRLMWKVSNRLVVTYLLIGLTPVVLFVTLALVAAYVFSGQFATFAAKSEINRELAHIASDNRAFVEHVSHTLEAEPNKRPVELPEFDDRGERGEHTALEVAAFENGKPLELLTSAPGRTGGGVAEVPSWLQKGSFRGLVVGNGQVFLRAVDSRTMGLRTVTLVTTLPLHKENVDLIASGLGQVTIYPTLGVEDEPGEGHDAGPAGSTGKESFQYHFDDSQPKKPSINVNGQPLGREQRGAVIGGTLPQPLHFFDVTVSFVTPLETILWTSGKGHTAFLEVDSRPSLLYGRLFEAALQVGAFVQDALISIAVFFGVLELIAFIMAVRLNRTITRSVNALYEATQAVDDDNLSYRIPVKRHDQLAALCRSFNEMTESLEKLLEEQREKERLQNELQIAHEVQANLFPQGNVALSMLELHGVCRPARSVSGDYYDFLVFGPSTLGLAIGDISGKGISAALLMATLHSAVRAYQFAGEELTTVGTNAALSPSFQALRNGVEEINCGEIFESPGKVLALLNRHLYRSTQPEKYATLFLGHYEGAESRLTYSNGGQLPPFVLRGDHSVTRLDRGGTVVGLIDGMSYDEGVVHLNRGDILIAYSDGVTEPENEFGDFGEERLLEVVGRNRHLPLATISDLVMQALRSWIGTQEQPDDITLVLARQR